MPDLDPSGLYTYPIELKIEILIRDPAALIDPDVAAQILGKNTRRPPVSIQGMESLFFGNFNETTTFELTFADPLALEIAQSANQPLSDILQPGNLLIEVIENPLMPVVLGADIDYSAGQGYGSIQMIIDGDAAFQRYQELLAKDKNAEPKLEGELTIKVTDLSPGGFSSTFTLPFLVSSGIESKPQASEEKSIDSEFSQLLAETVGDLLGEAEVWKVILQDRFRQINVDRPIVSIKKVTGGG